jgi:hypothetical protein
MQSQHINEILIEQRRRELEKLNPLTLEALEQAHRREGLRRSVASALMRLAFTLDHDAGVREALAR